jgi:hypothetical protein
MAQTSKLIEFSTKTRLTTSVGERKILFGINVQDLK